MLYVIPNSLIRVGIAGMSIVSAYMIIVATELSIATSFHAWRGILLPEGEEMLKIVKVLVMMMIHLPCQSCDWNHHLKMPFAST